MTQAAVLASNASLMTTPSGTAPGYLARAWVNFNGTGTVAIRASGNVSSITDRGVGQYTVNFTTAMPDANYACSGYGSTTASNSYGNFGWGITTKSTSSFNFETYIFAASSYIDSLVCDVAIFR